MGNNLTTEERRAEYVFFKARGICPVCRKRRIATGFSMCPECLERQANRTANRDKDKVNRRRKELYAQHKAEGICVSCKRRPAREGKTKCEVCARKERIARSARYVRIVKPGGICWRRGCENETAHGTRYCEAHYQEMVAHAKMMREKGMNEQTREKQRRWNRGL